MADTKTNEFLGTGRRKTSVARVRLSSGTGKVTVNGRAFETYFPTDSLRMVVQQPLNVTGMAGKFDIRANVSGGGPNGLTLQQCVNGISLRLLLVGCESSRLPEGGRSCDDARSAYERAKKHG